MKLWHIQLKAMGFGEYWFGCEGTKMAVILANFDSPEQINLPLHRFRLPVHGDQSRHKDIKPGGHRLVLEAAVPAFFNIVGRDVPGPEQRFAPPVKDLQRGNPEDGRIAEHREIVVKAIPFGLKELG